MSGARVEGAGRRIPDACCVLADSVTITPVDLNCTTAPSPENSYLQEVSSNGVVCNLLLTLHRAIGRKPNFYVILSVKGCFDKLISGNMFILLGSLAAGAIFQFTAIIFAFCVCTG